MCRIRKHIKITCEGHETQLKSCEEYTNFIKITCDEYENTIKVACDDNENTIKIM